MNNWLEIGWGIDVIANFLFVVLLALSLASWSFGNVPKTVRRVFAAFAVIFSLGALGRVLGDVWELSIYTPSLDYSHVMYADPLWFVIAYFFISAPIIFLGIGYPALLMRLFTHFSRR